MSGNPDGELRKWLNSIKDQEYTEKMMEFWQGFPKVDPYYRLYFLVRIPTRWTREHVKTRNFAIFYRAFILVISYTKSDLTGQISQF